MTYHFKSPVLAALTGLFIIAGCTPFTTPQAGRALYGQNCAACHGADARGGAQVPDLTALARRHGGDYPQAMVLDKLDGYARGQNAYAGAEMPEFGHLLTGRLTRVRTGRGLTRPLPERIVALDAYLRSIQQ
ncbi:c-type cytochrome [Roseinatronobacter alkalisoli]|uniref:Cytochrome c n=1 Tax=Roseinatronobacter alkalisoli TaxID=3028235 RepID=A0ABT5T5X4_9RHOB|nr:cytochrome c [Roseinatronobacter sp. HJB301]MDD7969811.1 cytochrome c [Roseinatronobacter sp. HJB301]